MTIIEKMAKLKRLEGIEIVDDLVSSQSSIDG